jgi:putative DNA primase/helicase
MSELNGHGDPPDGFERCTPGRPCPVCGATQWCQVIGGVLAQCMSVSKGSFRRGRQADGAEFYLHRLKEKVDLPAAPPLGRAPAEIVHAAYDHLLNRLGLLSITGPRREALRRRGLSDEQINRCQYRDYTGSHKRWDLARDLFERFGPVLFGVPGFIVTRNRNGEPYATTAGPEGLLIPVRDRAGKLVALKVRRDEPRGDNRYVYLSSRAEKSGWLGPKALNALHVPLGTDLSGPVLRVTEGPLKADVTAALSGVPTVGVPSAGSWRPAVDLLRTLPGVREVRVAFDGDFRTNPKVAGALAAFAAALRGIDKAVHLEVWDHAAAKGIDDALAAGLPTTVLDPEKSAEEVADACARLGMDSRWGCATTTRGEASAEGGAPDPHQSGVPNKALDDPCELARGFLARRYTGAGGRPTLRYLREDWHRWDGAAWPKLPDDAVRSELVAYCEQVFDADNLAKLAARAAGNAVGGEGGEGGKKEPPPEARKVTCRLINDVRQALVAQTILPHTLAPPAWLGDATGPDLRQCLFARNGVIDLAALVAGRTDYLTPPTPDLFNTTALPFAFDPAAPEPKEWLQFLADVWPGDAESPALLQQWFGYCITPDTRRQKIMLVVGPGRSGKGTIGRVLTALVGAANTAAPTLGSLAERFGLWPLLGKTLAVVGDAYLSGRADATLITERLKSISGEDLQTVDRKNREPVEARLGVRFLILTNEAPRLADSSAVITTRLLLLQTTLSHIGAEDLTLEERLLAELPGILLWAIAGWERLRRAGRFTQPAAGAETLRQMRELASKITAFVEDCCTRGPGLKAPVAEVYGAFRAWCAENGIEKPAARNLFSRDVQAAYPAVTVGREREGGGGMSPRLFRGLELLPGVPVAPE